MKFEIHTKNNRAKLIGDISEEIEYKLQSECLWTDELNFDHQILFYADGILYPGVSYRIKNILEEMGHECKIVLPELPKPQYNWPFTWKYRYKQEEFADELIKKRYGIGQASAGFGKSAGFASIICKVGLPSVVLVMEKEPQDQAIETLTDIIGEEYIGIIGDGVYKPNVVNVCMIQTLMQLIEKNDPFIEFLKNKAKIVVVDEAHAFTGDMAWKIFSILNSVEILVGVSATPLPSHSRAPFVEALIGPVHYNITYSELINEKVLCPLTLYTEKMPLKMYKIPGSQFARNRKYREIVDDYIVYNKERHKYIKGFVDEMLEENISVAVVCQQVEHAKSLHEMMPYGVVLTGRTPKKQREEIVRKLRNKEIMCVITTVFNQAVDIPSLGAVAIVAGGKSYVKLIQRIRSTRTFSGETATGHLTKTEGIVYYPYDRAPWLQNHSVAALKIFSELIAQHSLNKMVSV
ncbi:MAG TPA: DEAD/DEAH box helicase family protein [Aquella sp.]|nr:DEAD/DEAH box helicase family protein [Aquella sp.]